MCSFSDRLASSELIAFAFHLAFLHIPFKTEAIGAYTYTHRLEFCPGLLRARDRVAAPISNL